MSNNPNMGPEGFVRNRNWRPKTSTDKIKKMKAEEKRKLQEAAEREDRRLNEPGIIDTFLSAISKVKGLMANKNKKTPQRTNNNSR